MARFCNVVLLRLPMYLITGTCYSEGKSKEWNCKSFLHQIYEEKLF